MKYNNINMAVNFGYFVLFFFIVLFASIEFLFVIIPAILGRSKVKRKVQQTEFDIPEYIYRPASAEYIKQLRSWYFDHNDSFWHDNNNAMNPLSMIIAGDQPLNSRESHQGNLVPRADLKNISKANYQPQQSGVEDLDWIDEIPELNPLLLRSKDSFENLKNDR